MLLSVCCGIICLNSNSFIKNDRVDLVIWILVSKRIVNGRDKILLLSLNITNRSIICNN